MFPFTIVCDHMHVFEKGKASWLQTPAALHDASHSILTAYIEKCSTFHVELTLQPPHSFLSVYIVYHSRKCHIKLYLVEFFVISYMFPNSRIQHVREPITLMYGHQTKRGGF